MKRWKEISILPINLNEFEELLYGDIRYKIGITADNKNSALVRRMAISKLSSFFGSPDISAIIAYSGRAYCEDFWQSKDDFHSFIRDNGWVSPIYWKNIKFSYNKVCKMPLCYIFKNIGFGEHGIVFKHSKNKVEKISYTHFMSCEYRFYEYIMNHPISIFPRVYKLSKNRVILERLDTKHLKVAECSPLIQKYVKINDIGNSLNLKSVNWHLMIEELGNEHWFYTFLKDIENGFFEIFGTYALGDLTPNNIGVRNDGSIVFYDPINYITHTKIYGDAY